MATFSPKSITIVEADPGAAASFNVTILRHVDGATLATASYPANPSGTTVIPIGSNGLITSAMANVEIQVEVEEVGATGALGPATLVYTPDGHNFVLVSEIPSGNFTLTMQL